MHLQTDHLCQEMMSQELQLNLYKIKQEFYGDLECGWGGVLYKYHKYQ